MSVDDLMADYERAAVAFRLAELHLERCLKKLDEVRAAVRAAVGSKWEVTVNLKETIQAPQQPATSTPEL